ncbi:Uu.00g086150.m01.CDS01 [Anthostomella pinea]|uniref:Uu.00g086150.m01.CDS01 n=1 Tax=Anthostomella pinea TaxID=933095 RepID=A0AAI8VM43_9PEZI|nr:Uu.00g086150.m01.CDS01 [Anthostomella pinea]
MSQHHPRRRPQSRASTASVHSIATQPTLEQNLAVPNHGSYAEQWNAGDHGAMPQPKDMSSMGHHMGSHMGSHMISHMGPQMGSQMGSQVGSQMSAEDINLRPGSRMQSASFSGDSNMHQPVGSAMPSYSQHPGLHHGLSAETYGASASFTDPDSQMMDRDELDEGDPLAAPQAGQKPASSRTSANNELEMRQLFQYNKHRKLGEVAQELHGNERGPNSERTRQVFAMLWINSVCTKGKGSVPRGRVYANYASRCATERITVLNPASFGKLVRVLFPGLKTRRLGVRGESKYHYVNFTLMDDQPELREPAIQPALPMPEPSSFAQTFNTSHSQSPAMNAERPALPSPQIPQASATPAGPPSAQNKAHSLYNQPDVANLAQLHSTTSKTMLRLSFAQDGEDSFHQSDPLILPRIEPFLPNGTDPDSAKSLAALYRSHCTSLVECIRYCKEKTFFHLFTSFQGTLTMPVQKLFNNPSVAAWIEECDFVLYQRMMRIISGLTLQVVPKPVLDTLRNISEKLVPHIRESFQGQPRHVVEAKEAPATIFAALLDRALRVNLTAHAAANMLSNPANRDQMYLDWITMVRIRKVAECVPTKGMDDLVNLLLNELRGLLYPLNVPWEIEMLTLYGDMAAQNDRSPHAADSDDFSAQNMLDRWVQFLRSLPGRFPYASPAEIVTYVQRVGTEVMRDLTIAQGKSFGSWWVTKCWIDEMISFLAEQGGFIQTRNSSPSPAVARGSKHPIAAQDTNQQGSRLSSGSEDLNVSQMSQSQPDRAPFPSQLDGPDSLQVANHDDSGIGIRTPEEDLPMDKFEFQAGQDQALRSLDLDRGMQ